MKERKTGIIKNKKTGNKFEVTEQHLLKLMQDKYKKNDYEIVECSEEVKQILEVKELENNPHSRIIGKQVFKKQKKAKE